MLIHIIEAPDLDPIQEDERERLLQMIIKMADMGHLLKPLGLTLEWTARLSAEYFLQGDLERSKKMPISPFMDRYVRHDVHVM